MYSTTAQEGPEGPDVSSEDQPRDYTGAYTYKGYCAADARCFVFLAGECPWDSCYLWCDSWDKEHSKEQPYVVLVTQKNANKDVNHLTC